MDLTKDTDSETPRPMRTLQHLASDPEETTQQERREAQWAQDARELEEAGATSERQSIGRSSEGTNTTQMEGDANAGDNYVPQASYTGVVHTIL